MNQLFSPFGAISKKGNAILSVLWVVIMLLLFELARSPIVPSPIRVGKSLVLLLQSRDLYENFFNSLVMTVKAMAFSIIITMAVCYLSVIPVFKPISQFISKCRYLTITGLVFLFTMIVSNVGELKTSLLLFGITPFFVTSFLSVINAIPQQEIDKAYVNRLNKWQTLYEIIIIGRLDVLLDVMRQNFAISWMMITAVEGFAMSEGGIGSMMIKSNKYLDLGPVFALLIIVLLTGMLFDYTLSSLRKMLFPYLNLKK